MIWLAWKWLWEAPGQLRCKWFGHTYDKAIGFDLARFMDVYYEFNQCIRCDHPNPDWIETPGAKTSNYAPGKSITGQPYGDGARYAAEKIGR